MLGKRNYYCIRWWIFNPYISCNHCICFIGYVSSGFELNFMVAVDFTGKYSSALQD